MAEQAGRLAYAHGSVFTTEPLEAYAREVGPLSARGRPGHLPGVGRIRGHRDGAQAGPGLSPRPRRDGPLDGVRPMGELPRQHPGRPGPVGPPAAPSTLRGVARSLPSRVGGIPVSGGRPGIERPRRPGRARRWSWTGRSRRPGRERWPPSSPSRSSAPRSRRSFRPTGYWPAIAEVCRRHGVLLIADEVMTGFGRTGRWFGLDHWGVRPDLLVAAKGATSGYWPFGFVAASGRIHDSGHGARRRVRPRVHLLALAGRRRRRARGVAHPREESLVEASAAKGIGSCRRSCTIDSMRTTPSAISAAGV